MKNEIKVKAITIALIASVLFLAVVVDTSHTWWHGFRSLQAQHMLAHAEHGWQV